MNKQEAHKILETMVDNPALITHCKSVALVMEVIARQTKQNPDDFYIAGLLHDADWEKHPAEHPNVIVNLLEEKGEYEISHAISAHGTEWGIEYKSIMDRALVAVDEITGLIYAVARLRPDGLCGLTVESVMRKFKNKGFAAGVDREEVKRGVSILGVELESLIHFIVGVLQPHSEDLGLSPCDDLVFINLLHIPEHNGVIMKQEVKVIEKKIVVKVSEQQLIRTKKRQDLIGLNIDPYPGDLAPINCKANCVTAGAHNEGEEVSIAGRIMVFRVQGKAGFFELEDEFGTVQLYFNAIGEKALSPEKVELLKKYIDRGDIIWVTGFVFLTQTKVFTIHITDIKLLTKSLRPLPSVKEVDNNGTGEKKIYDAFTNPELRYRQRYVDLIVNPDVREIFKKRTRLVDTIRNAFNAQDFLEVQTPILQPIYGGATARPFVTHHNTLDMKLYLRIANELYLKRLIVGGYNGVYEFSVDFRNEGMSRFHNPEFTQVELYVAYKDYNWMMDLVESTVEKVALNISGSTKIETFGHQVDFKRPWKRMTMREAILEKADIDIAVLDESGLKEAAEKAGLKLGEDVIGKGKTIDEIFGHFVEPYLIQPCFITSYPVELSPLAKRTAGNPEFTDRFEGFVCGKEFCNAFSELNDPIDQRKRFEEQLTLAKRGDMEAMMLDEDFLRALEYGMPPTAGLGLGIDRLAMVMLNKNSIQEVILFPQMKPEA